jgi:hypothetical protein
MKRLTEMTRTELAAWYEAQVGYNPLQDDPKLSTEELLRDCQDYAAEADLCPVYGN